MTQINRLQAALRTHLPWHGVRLTFLALFLVALFRVETVNLDKLSSVFANRAKPESSYNRLTRFLREFPVEVVHFRRLIRILCKSPFRERKIKGLSPVKHDFLNTPVKG